MVVGGKDCLLRLKHRFWCWCPFLGRRCSCLSTRLELPVVSTEHRGLTTRTSPHRNKLFLLFSNFKAIYLISFYFSQTKNRRFREEMVQVLHFLQCGLHFLRRINAESQVANSPVRKRFNNHCGPVFCLIGTD
jgi:uncharacterized membrane protein SirB2